MPELAQQQCEACSGSTQPLGSEEIEELKPAVADWEVIEESGEKKLRRSYSFKDFAAALVFTNKVGDIAEDVGHHPMLITEYGQVTVLWWTHKIGGLHKTDFIMAARTDQLLGD